MTVAMAIAMAPGPGPGPARAGSPPSPLTAQQYQQLNAAGANSFGTAADLTARAGATAAQTSAASALALAQGSVQAAGGDASATRVVSSAHGAGMARSLADRALDRVSVMDYATPGSMPGRGVYAMILQAQAVGDTSVLLPGSIGGWAVGRLATCTCLPAGTTVTTVGAMTPVAVSYPTASASPYIPGFGVNALAFAGTFAVPPGAAVSGAGIAPGTSVLAVSVGAGTTTIYLNQALASSGVAAGAPIGFTYFTTKATLSAGFTIAPAAGTRFGIAFQDDYQTFVNAAFQLAPEHGGQGGSIYVPSGMYYLGTALGSYAGVSWELGSHVGFLPGSQSIDALVVPNVQRDSAVTFANDARNPTDTTVTISQQLFQPQLPVQQQQALLIHTSNVNCTGTPGPGSYGCGEIGIELQEDMAPQITQGVLWGYHAVLYQRPGQKLAGSLSELEWNNTSGNDEPALNQVDSVLGLHLDQIGNTPGTAGIKFGGTRNAYWHVGLACDAQSIHDWCIAVYDPNSATSNLSDIIAGLRPDGSLLAQTGQIQAGIVTAQSAGYTMRRSDCGTTIRDTGATAHTMTVPAGLPLGCSIELIQAGAGTISFTGASGIAAEEFVASGSGSYATAGQFARARVLVDSASSFLLSGNVQ